jgi:hypothetical protein
MENTGGLLSRKLFLTENPQIYSELNRVIGCACTMLNTLEAESFDASAKAKNILLEKCKR